MFTYSYTARWFFCTHLLLLVRQILQSIHWIPREQAASKISEWKICAYTGMSEKMGPFIYQSRKIGSVIYLLSKKGSQSYTWQRWKRGPFGMHTCTMTYIGSYPPPLNPPLPRVWIILNSKKDYRLLQKGPVQIGKLPSFFHFVVLTKTSIGSAYVTINKVFISANLIISSLLRTLPGSSYLLNFVYRLSERLSK